MLSINRNEDLAPWGRPHWEHHYSLKEELDKILPAFDRALTDLLDEASKKLEDPETAAKILAEFSRSPQALAGKTRLTEEVSFPSLGEARLIGEVYDGVVGETLLNLIGFGRDVKSGTTLKFPKL